MSSHQEPDKPLYPSRLGRKQINPWIPIPLEDRLRRFLAVNRHFKLQDFVSEAIEDKLDALENETARAAVQPCSRADEDQISDLRISETETDRSNQISDIVDESARAAVQLREQLLTTLRQTISASIVATWFEPLKLEVNGERVTLIAPNQIVKDWLGRNCEPVLRAALREIGVTHFTWSIAFTQTTSTTEEQSGPQRAGDIKDELLAYYAVVTSNSVKDYDVEDFQLIASCSIASVKAGILQSQLNVKGGKVKKFKYCVKAILTIEIAGLGPQNLVRLERQWQRSLPGFGADVVPIGGR